MSVKLLLVDDEVELVTTLAERLSIRGFEVKWTTTSDDALKQVESDSFDVAVLDLKMPKICGLKLKEALQKKYPEMKFIFLTGYGSEEDYRKISDQIGEEFYLVKPVDIDVLVEKINIVVKTKTKKDEIP
jgi:DNA-binding response OmpR family regulator